MPFLFSPRSSPLFLFLCLFARSALVSLLLLFAWMLIYYVILCSVLCYSSPLGYHLSQLRCEKRLRTSTTLPHFSQNKNTSSSPLSFVVVVVQLRLHRFVASRTQTYAILVKSMQWNAKPSNNEWWWFFLFDYYKLCDQNVKKNIFALFTSQQLVLCFARALRFCGLTQKFIVSQSFIYCGANKQLAIKIISTHF